MNKLITLIIGLAVLWALFEFGAKSRAPIIQADIQNRTETAISDAALNGVSVSTDGRDITLSGNVSSDADLALAGDTGTSVQDLASHEVEPLRARFRAVNEEEHRVAELPGEKRVSKFIEEAKGLDAVLPDRA